MRFEEIPTAWRGHEQFAEWLVRTMKANTIVDLGVDYGFSTIALARALQLSSARGVVYAVDWFQGDPQTGSRDPSSARRQFDENLRDAGLELKMDVEVLQQTFDQAADWWQHTGQFRSGDIDILHVDGLHTYEAVKHDFATWSHFVRYGGVILLHDTQSFPNDVGRFFREIDWPKFEFVHSAGLGVVCRP